MPHVATLAPLDTNGRLRRLFVELTSLMQILVSTRISDLDCVGSKILFATCRNFCAD